MPGITLAQAETHLSEWLTADSALATGKSYSIEGRTVTHAETQSQIKFWNSMVQDLGGGGFKVRGVTAVIDQ